MKTENCTTEEKLDAMLQDMDTFIQEHPPITPEVFTETLNQAKQLKNEKLISQCERTIARCKETQSKLNSRRNALQRAKVQLMKAKSDSPCNCIVKSSGPDIDDTYLLAPAVSKKTSSWHVTCTSLPTSPKLHPRRSSLPNKGEVVQVSPISNLSSQNMEEYQEQLFNDGLITEDMSHRIVTSLPKSLTLRPTPDTNDCDTHGTREGSLFSRLPFSKKHMTRTVTVPVAQSYSMSQMQLSSSQTIPQMDGSLTIEPLPSSISSNSSQNSSSSSMPDELASSLHLASSCRYLTDPPIHPHLHTSPDLGNPPTPVNSHLFYLNAPENESWCTSPDGSPSIETGQKRTLSLILQELISTERDYVWALQLIVDNYIPEIKKDDVPQALRGKRNVIFGNIEKIYEFHSRHFLQELENCKQQPFQIAQTFLSHEEQFYLYALYNKNKPKSDQLMQEHGTAYFRRKQFELNDKMNLSSYLLRPVQRMGKYALLLKQMLKECPESDNEFADLKNAEEMVKFHLRHGNDLLAMDSLKDCDVNLQEQGRLLRQDEFMVTQGRKKFMRHIFLFEELILFSKTKRNRQGGPESYVYKYSFKTSDIGLTENFRDKSNKFEIWFRRRSLGENYILHAQCSEMKNSWVGEISRLLWKQAIKNRESRKCEMASMGMGNKPCMDLKGDFNINDRLINVTPTQSLARSRNSIAVTSVDHFRNGNKRPISITSLSSTSSSSSGQSANHGLLNSLNLAFEALNAGSNTATDSPHFNRRSMNSSNESGICTDIFLEPDVPVSNRGIPAGSNSAATLPANMRLLPTSARSGAVADSNEKKEEPKDKSTVPDTPSDMETPVSSATCFTPLTTTPKQADPGKLWLDLSKIRTPPELKVRVLGPSQPKISSINAEESEL
ncbi:Puratrophin-1,Pleckstrin homology domain-containing family G member 4B [Acanthosepion pharaonis]|uniref:Puratrophin-1,Pleckstrin homology domain-containing family G member 4B n=1 Tax=Acanthosepion pharaonis TaxID=158019 RepID=A0A812DBR4_ACAPH|nr:Puratrophin-1,Pleckstrin homology domain-containing family G member 4B [Sepia pharaonis]